MILVIFITFKFTNLGILAHDIEDKMDMDNQNKTKLPVHHDNDVVSNKSIEIILDNNDINVVMSQMKTILVNSTYEFNSNDIVSNLKMVFNLSQQLNNEVVWHVHNFLLTSDQRLAKRTPKKENLHNILLELQLENSKASCQVSGFNELKMKVRNQFNLVEYQYLCDKLAIADNILHKEVKKLIDSINHNSKLFYLEFVKFTNNFNRAITSMLIDESNVFDFASKYQDKLRSIRIIENTICQTCENSQKFSIEHFKKLLIAVQAQFGWIPYNAKYDLVKEECHIVYNVDSILRNIYILYRYEDILSVWINSINDNCIEEERNWFKKIWFTIFTRCNKTIEQNRNILISLRQQVSFINDLFFNFLIVFKVNTRYEFADDFTELQQFHEISKSFLSEIIHSINNSKPLTSFKNKLNRGIEESDHVEWMLDSIHHAKLRNQKLEQRVKSILSTAMVVPVTAFGFTVTSIFEGLTESLSSIHYVMWETIIDLVYFAVIYLVIIFVSFKFMQVFWFFLTKRILLVWIEKAFKNKFGWCISDNQMPSTIKF